MLEISIIELARGLVAVTPWLPESVATCERRQSGRWGIARPGSRPSNTARVSAELP